MNKAAVHSGRFAGDPFFMGVCYSVLEQRNRTHRHYRQETGLLLQGGPGLSD